MTLHAGTSITLVDAHVHYQTCFSVADFLDGSSRNFQQAADKAAPGAEFEGVLILTESRGVDWYAEIAAPEGNARTAAAEAGWSIRNTDEEEAIRLCHSDGRRLVLVSGRQVVTAERMEVLWLGTRAKPEDGAPLQEVIRNARLAGAVPVIPWGFGKWMGGRGQHLRQILSDDTGPAQPAVHLGDNGGRPFFWPMPAPLRQTLKTHRRNIPGTDPLPFADEIVRPGSYGCWFEGRLESDAPAAHLKRLIDDPRVTLNPYGQLERALRFIRHQVAMQMHLRTGGRTRHAA